MRRKENKDVKKLIDSAMEREGCDLTIKNIKLVNVFTGLIYDAEIDITDGYIVYIRKNGEQNKLEAKEVYDGNGGYLIPGFIDTHMHVESTMMIPENLSRAIVPLGTTTVCTDPHEIGNVCGMDGVKFMLDNAEKSSLRQYVLAPSCVPAVPYLECAGAEFNAEETGKLLDTDNVIGVAELMDFVGVYNNAEKIHSIIAEGAKRDMFLQGHAPFVSGRELAAYRISGIESDHESETAEEIEEKLRLGMHIDIRSSSLVNHLSMLVEGLKKIPYHDFVSICTDDVHAGDLLEKGHINFIVKRLIEEGIEPVDVIRMATLNAAREYGFKDLGAIAPGYIADIQIVEKLDGNTPKAVFVNGKLMAENGIYKGSDKNEEDESFENTVNVGWVDGKECFELKSDKNDGFENVNVIIPLDAGNVMRKVEAQKLPVINGKVDISEREDLVFVCALNRYGKKNATVGVMQNFGLYKGGIATTVSHDSHNMVLIYKNPDDAYCLMKELEKNGGGFAAAENGKITGSLKLPVAGLMSDKGCKETADEQSRYKEAFYKLCDERTSMMSCSMMSLTALPGVVITDCGLVDGLKQEFIPVILK